jgi:hypothetical protein
VLERGHGGQLVDNERPSPRGQAVADERPQGVKALGWHVREPRREEDQVVALPRAPGEQIRLDEAHVRRLSRRRQISSASGEESTAVTADAWRASSVVHWPVPHASSSTLP